MAKPRVRTIRGKNPVGWSRCRGAGSSPEDAGDSITKLPKAEHEAPEWQAGMEALMLVATHGCPTTFARNGVMRALNRHVERVFNSGPARPHVRGSGCSRAIDESFACGFQN
jgi:hypothetical protein